MRLLLVQGGFGAGGAEKVMAALANHRAARGDQVHVAAMTMPFAGPFFAYDSAVQLHVINSGRGLLRHPVRAKGIRRLIGQTEPDLVISFLTKVNCLTLIAALGTGVPVVVSERNNPAEQSGRSWRRLQAALLPRATGIAMQTSDAVSDLPPTAARRAHVIANPCSPIAFTPGPPSSRCRFVAVGRLDPQKGFDRLIEAFAALPPDLPVELAIFGAGPLRGALQQQIQSLGATSRIRLAGQAASPAVWLSAGDVLVLSSRYEGFSNVLAEAATSGLPAVAFDCPFGVRDIIEDGVNGLVVPNGDLQALKAAMEHLARETALRARLSQSPQLVAARLDPARILARWDSLIAESASAPCREATAITAPTQSGPHVRR